MIGVPRASEEGGPGDRDWRSWPQAIALHSAVLGLLPVYGGYCSGHCKPQEGAVFTALSLALITMPGIRSYKVMGQV